MPMKKLRRHVISAGVVLSLALLLTWQGVAAHALLVRSLPAANAELSAPPTVIELWFSEELEPQFSQAYLVDTAGNEIGRGTATVDQADPMHMSLPVPALTPGLYSVVYHTLSRADGHEWIGSFPLTILHPDGTQPTGSETNAPTVEASGRGALPTPLEVLSRWLGLLGGLLVLGHVVLGGSHPRHSPRHPLSQPPAEQPVLVLVNRAIQLALLVGIGLLLAGSWLQLGTQLHALGDRGTLTALLGQTRSGNLLLSRQLLAFGLLVITISAHSKTAFRPARKSAPGLKPVQEWVWRLGFVLSVAILGTFAVGSHAAGVVGSGWAILGDFIHLAAAAIWLGGLYLLAYLCWQLRLPATTDAALLGQLIRRFSIVATLAVFVLTVTGFFSSLVQLETVNLLWRSPYGWLLLTKIGIVLLLLSLALRNHRLVRKPQPASTGWTADQYRTFRRQLWGESLLGLLIMLVVAILVQTPIPRSASTSATPAPAPYFETILSADDLTIHLQISPNQVGQNRYTTHLYHTDNSPIGTVQLVRLAFVHQSGELGQATLELAAQGGDLFMATGAYQNRSGPWDLSVYVRRRGLDDSLVNTVVTVPAPVVAATAPSRRPWQNPIPALPPVTLIESAIFAIVLGFLLWRYAANFSNK